MTKRVLVADDSPVARAAVAGRVRAVCTVVEASSVAEAAAVAGPFACAVLDLDLGDGTGVEIANALRARTPALPIAFFSGGAAPEIVQAARGLGLVFGKSAELDALVAGVENVISRA